MRLIYALIMIAGFALLLWSIDKSMPVYADSFNDCKAMQEQGLAIGCGDTIYVLDDPVIRIPDSELLKECEEELASLRSYVDSLNWVTIPEGWKVESVEGEWSEEEK